MIPQVVPNEVANIQPVYPYEFHSGLWGGEGIVGGFKAPPRQKHQPGTRILSFSNRNTLVQSWVRFCQHEFGKFPWPAWAVGSYSSGQPAGGTHQILIIKT